MTKEELEKENAELKDKLNNWVKCAELRLANWQKYEKQLTKAKEILQVVLDKWKKDRWILYSDEKIKQIENLMEQTEQFLEKVK